jgi:hypothetical protein
MLLKAKHLRDPAHLSGPTDDLAWDLRSMVDAQRLPREVFVAVVAAAKLFAGTPRYHCIPVPRQLAPSGPSTNP